MTLYLQLKPSAKGLRRNHAHWCLGEEDCLPADICLGSEPESHSVAQLKSPWLLYQASITYTKTHRKTFLYLATWVLPICLSIDDGLANLQFTVNPEGTQFQLRPFLSQSENYAGNFWEMCPYWGHQGRLTSLPPTEDPKGSHSGSSSSQWILETVPPVQGTEKRHDHQGHWVPA